jgi:hypothetical protein
LLIGRRWPSDSKPLAWYRTPRTNLANTSVTPVRK